MDFDVIVKEWFYRLPKGYADAPYTEEELAVLDEVLNEHGVVLTEVDELDQAFLEAEPVEELDEYDEIVTEADDEPVLLSKRELADILINGAYSEKNLKRIQNLITRNADAEFELERFLREEIVSSAEAKKIDEVVDIMLAGGTDQQKLLEYIKNRDIKWTEFFGKPTSLEVFTKTGLSKTALSQLSTYRPSGAKGVGPIEWLLAILLKGGARPRGHGDLLVDNMPFEVKALGGRLKSQNGTGGADSVRAEFINQYNIIASGKSSIPLIPAIQVGAGATKLTDTDQTLQVITTPAAWSRGNFFNTLDIMNKRIVELTDDDTGALDMISKAINTALHAHNILDDTDYTKWIRDSLNNDGSIDRKKFVREWATASFYYYIQTADASTEGKAKEPIKYFVASNQGTGQAEKTFAAVKIMIFEIADFPNLLGSQIGIDLPDFGPSAGIGNAFGMKLGSKSGYL
jgi:hypothetical protein